MDGLMSRLLGGDEAHDPMKGHHSSPHKGGGHDTCGKPLSDTHGSHSVNITCTSLIDPRNRTHWSHEAYMSIIWPLVVLTLGTIFNYLSSRFHFLQHVPYTSFVMVMGIFLGAMHRGTDCGLEYLSLSIHMWGEINSHLLLYVFLPLLLFADSMNLNLHLVWQTLIQCLLLAIVGVVIGTVLTAVVAKNILPYNWTWHQCFMVGSILSATDPVAVVGLLKSLGASPVLTMQIAGESLFNDGVAIVLFNVFYALVVADIAPESGFPGGDIMITDPSDPRYTAEHGQANQTIKDELLAGYITKTFVWMFFFALIWGVFIGAVFWFLIYISDRPKDHGDSQNQITYTMILAFLAYTVGEGVFKTSGVLSTVFAGIVMGAAMWPSVVSREAMEHVWHSIEFILNTVLFALAGTIIGNEVVHFSKDSWFIMMKSKCQTNTLTGAVMDEVRYFLKQIHLYPNATASLSPQDIQFMDGIKGGGLTTCELYYSNEETDKTVDNFLKFLNITDKITGQNNYKYFKPDLRETALNNARDYDPTGALRAGKVPACKLREKWRRWNTSYEQ